MISSWTQIRKRVCLLKNDLYKLQITTNRICQRLGRFKWCKVHGLSGTSWNDATTNTPQLSDPRLFNHQRFRNQVEQWEQQRHCHHVTQWFQICLQVAGTSRTIDKAVWVSGGQSRIATFAETWCIWTPKGKAKENCQFAMDVSENGCPPVMATPP